MQRERCNIPKNARKGKASFATLRNDEHGDIVVAVKVKVKVKVEMNVNVAVPPQCLFSAGLPKPYPRKKTLLAEVVVEPVVAAAIELL